MAVDRGPGLGEVDAYRPWFREHVRPRGYSPPLHVVLHLGPVIGAVVFAASQLSQVTLLEWLAVPLWLTLGSSFVYWFHRFVLHRPRPWAHFAYVRHTLQHHRFFDYEHITPDEPEDLYVTLFPWWSGVLLSALSFGVSLALTPWVGGNLAHLTMLMMALYMLLYEVTHTLCHVRDDNPWLRVPAVRFLRAHHRLHHDPALMGKHNFNVVLPLFDWCFGALVRKRPEKSDA